MIKTQCNNSLFPICYSLDSVSELYDPTVSFSRVEACDKLEIALIVSGSGMHQIMNQTVPCKENDIFLIPAHIPHAYFVNEENASLNIRRVLVDLNAFYSDGTEIPGDSRFCFGLFRDNSISAYAMLNSKTKAELEQLFDKISDEIKDKKQEWLSAVRANITLTFITLCRYVNSAIRNAQTFPPKEWHIVSSAIRMVTDRFQDSELTLESIALALYISKSQLSRIFNRLTGEPFSSYLRRVRISHACRLLQYTDVAVDEVVSRCGLKDLPSFYRNFQQLIGMTPKQYRQQVFISKSKFDKRIGSVLNEITEAISSGESKKIKELIEEAINLKITTQEILNALLNGMNTVGEKFINNRAYVPEVLVSARAMNTGIQLLRPLLVKDGIKPVGRVCIGTVQGDLHDIGKNLVKMMLEGRGIEVIDLGTDVSPDEFIKTAIEHDCRAICCSALLTTTLGAMADVVKKAVEAGIRDKVKILIGGAPVSERYCREIGADFYSSDAATCANIAYKICCEFNDNKEH